MGNLPKSIQNRIPILKTSENYINLKKLKFSKDEEKAGYEDKFDGFIIENNSFFFMIISYYIRV